MVGSQYSPCNIEADANFHSLKANVSYSFLQRLSDACKTLRVSCERNISLILNCYHKYMLLKPSDNADIMSVASRFRPRPLTYDVG